MKLQDILTGLSFGLGLLLCSYLFASGGPSRPAFYLPEHITLESRDLVRETSDGRELTRYLSRCYQVVRWNAKSRDVVPSGTMPKVRRLMDSMPPTENEWKACAKEFGARGWSYWYVARYRLYRTRPLYEWVNGEKGRKVGVVNYKTRCERKTLKRSSWGREWRFTTNADGLRGAAVCTKASQSLEPIKRRSE